MEPRPEDSPTLVTQLRQALEYAREYIADLQERHEAALNSYHQNELRMRARIDWLEGQVSKEIVLQSKKLRVN
jgi:hypothetical protein